MSVALAPPSLPAPWRRGRSQRLRWSLLLTGSLLVLACLLALSLGAFGLRPGQVLAALWARLGISSAGAVDSRHELVLFAIRLPRVLVAILVGATLSCAGAAMQGIFRNPLADPGLVGVTSGAALAASTTIVLGGLVTEKLPEGFRLFFLPVAAFAGGLAATAAVWRFARRDGRVAILLLLLAGVAVNALSGALTGLLTTVASDPQLRTLTFWSLGSLGGASWRTLGAFLPFAVVSLLLLPALARPLNAILLGEPEARHLGVEVERLKKLVVVAASLGVGSAVAFVGSIGFVGLVGPHLARLLVGPDHRALFPLAGVLGALLLVLADLVARTVVSPAELPLGVVTGLLGAPFFLLLLARTGRRGGGAMIVGSDLGLKRGGRWLLRGVTLQVAAGEVVALLGPNGAGKTTLLRLLAGDGTPDQGAVHLLGKPLHRWPARELARMRAVLSQSSSLEFGFTAFEVALMGRMPHVELKESPEDLAIVQAALEGAGVAHLADRVYTTLSGGERQRVQLARVMAQLGETAVGRGRVQAPSPRLLLLDEPTSNLDVAHQHAALALARLQAAQGAAVLAVLHDLNLAGQYADRLALLRDGQLVACGLPADVLTIENIWRVFEVNTVVVPHPTLPVPLVVTTGSGRATPTSVERMQA